MRATLIYNANAGDGAVPERAELVGAIEKLGWRVTPLDRSELEEAAASPGDAVIVAGGDGTVGNVAKRFAGTGVPIAVIPIGTANNVARSLGVGLEPHRAIDSLARAVRREVDLGVVSYGDREERFIEGFGLGVFAHLMAQRARRKSTSLGGAFRLLAREVESYQPHHARIEVDRREVEGDYLLVSVLNLPSLGPALKLALRTRSSTTESSTGPRSTPGR